MINSKIIKNKNEPITREKLIIMIENDEDIRFVNTSQITDFSYLFFKNKTFNQNIEHWDVSNGTDFYAMFYSAVSFNQPLNNWDVSNGTDFSYMFYGATSFNKPLNNWELSKCTDFEIMLNNTINFDKNIYSFIEKKGSLSHLLIFLKGNDIGCIDINNNFFLFHLNNEISVKDFSNNKITPLNEFQKENKNILTCLKIDRNNELYQLFEMKYADSHNLLNNDKFYLHNDELYDSKLKTFKDIFIDDNSFKELILNMH